jgi:hypothetical protein
MKPNWGVNVEEFKKRFDPEKTNGQGNSISSLYKAAKVPLTIILTLPSSH